MNNYGKKVVKAYKESYLGSSIEGFIKGIRTSNSNLNKVFRGIMNILKCFQASKILSIDFVLRKYKLKYCAPHIPILLERRRQYKTKTIMESLKKLYRGKGKWSVEEKCIY